MDVFQPTANANGLGIIDVLSGAWHSDAAQVRDHTRAQVFHIYCSRGYTVFMVRPGSRPLFTFEEMVRNINIGIRYVKYHADEYKVDPDRLGITGASAGGHLTLLAMANVESGNPDAKEPMEKLSTEVKAIAVFFPPTDFLDWRDGPIQINMISTLLFYGGMQGRSEEEAWEQAKKTSPYHQVKQAFPPTIIIHGDADTTVPIEQSKKMVEALEKAGGITKFIVKPGGGHPWLTIPEEVNVFADWFDEHL